MPLLEYTISPTYACAHTRPSHDTHTLAIAALRLHAARGLLRGRSDPPIRVGGDARRLPLRVCVVCAYFVHICKDMLLPCCSTFCTHRHSMHSGTNVISLAVVLPSRTGIPTRPMRRQTLCSRTGYRLVLSLSAHRKTREICAQMPFPFSHSHFANTGIPTRPMRRPTLCLRICCCC